MASKRGVEAGRAYVKAWLDDTEFQKGLTKLSGSLKSFGSKLSSIGKGMMALGGGVVAAFVPMIKAAADAEKAAVGFEVLLGSATKAKRVMEDLNEFAASTPFELPELTAATRSLLAFGVAQEDLLKTLKAVGDVAAAIDAPIGEIAEIYGKAKVQGRLFMEDINQLTGRGIPIIQELAKQFGVAESEVRNLVSSGQVNFGHLEAAFQSLTGEGGKFGGMMDRLSGTAAGKWSTLMDSIAATGRTIGGALLPMLTPVMDQMTRAAESVAAWSEKNKGLAATIFKIAAAVTAIGGVLTGFGFAFNAIGSAILAAKSAAMLLAASLPALGLALGAVAIGYFAYQLYAANAAIKDLNREIERSQQLTQQGDRGQDKRRKAVMDSAADIKDPAERAAFLKKALEDAEKNVSGTQASAAGARRRAVETKENQRTAFGTKPLLGLNGAKLVEGAEREAEQAARNATRAEDFAESLKDMRRATEREKEGLAAIPTTPAVPTQEGDMFGSAWDAGVDKLVGGIENAAEKLGLITPKMDGADTEAWLKGLWDTTMGAGMDDEDDPKKPRVSNAVNTAAAVGSSVGNDAILRAMAGGRSNEQIQKDMLKAQQETAKGVKDLGKNPIVISPATTA